MVFDKTGTLTAGRPQVVDYRVWQQDTAVRTGWPAAAAAAAAAPVAPDESPSDATASFSTPWGLPTP